jgi:hypothetical protein
MSGKRGFELTYLLDERGSDPVDKSLCREINDLAVPSCLRDLSNRLRAYAADVLRGDFSVFPKLAARADQTEREENRKYLADGDS